MAPLALLNQVVFSILAWTRSRKRAKSKNCSKSGEFRSLKNRRIGRSFVSTRQTACEMDFTASLEPLTGRSEGAVSIGRQEFVSLQGRVPIGVLEGHAQRGDFSRWPS